MGLPGLWTVLKPSTVVEAFGFEWRMAPGEAEAELAYLNKAGIIDGILSDNVDTFIFGAHRVICNPSSTHPGDKRLQHHVHVYSDIQLSHAHLIFIALCIGGDYSQSGLQGCSVNTALALAQCGFADSLYTAATILPRKSLPNYLCQWHADLVTEPITSLSEGQADFYKDLSWTEREPLVPELTRVCEFYFEWGFEATILTHFCTCIWPSILLSPHEPFLAMKAHQQTSICPLHTSLTKSML
ncbi:PIN domain-like protein [Armillaria gallica]|uniref:PIN domain-like protein n=1 Tax=Armillaria gallica TaxID=47427 RepID=A0A2H3D9Y1_ARMGA|nr:PIN domain-like protein [Armillaria gallica]